MAEPLTRVDSAVDGLSTSPPKVKTENRVDSGIADVEESPTKEKAEQTEKSAAAARRKSSMVAGVYNIRDLKENRTTLEIAKETQGTGWKINTSPMSIDEPQILSKHLVEPPVRSIDMHLGNNIVVRAGMNKNGVTIKDAMNAIYKHYKKKDDDEIDYPYLVGFEWKPNNEYLQAEEREEERLAEWDRLYVHFAVNSTAKFTSGGKKKNKKAE